MSEDRIALDRNDRATIHQAAAHAPPRLAGNHAWHIDCIVGARPNFIKIAPIVRALAKHRGLSTRVIHTGQHYDVAMSRVFFEELAIPQPDINLGVGSGTSTAQTAQIMMRLDAVFRQHRPDLVLVVGDVNSTAAAAYAASHLGIPIAHVEAGLRSFDKAMPEEINRLVTDRLADLLFTTESSATSNVIREGVAPNRIKFVGNVMIDTLHHCILRAVPVADSLAPHAKPEFLSRAMHGFGLVTLHRPSNVDDPVQLHGLLTALRDLAPDCPLVFPLHPRTRARIGEFGLNGFLTDERILATPPLGYLSMLGLMREATYVVTDSGGVQEETTALGVPCLTVRDTTERPVTLTEGSNTLVGTSPAALISAATSVLQAGGKRGRVPPLWDGGASDRIAAEIEAFLNREVSASTACAA